MTREPCVFCGGSNHPGTCGEPIEDAPVPWAGIFLFLVLPVVVSLISVLT